MGITQLTLCTGRDILAVLQTTYARMGMTPRQESVSVGATRYVGKVCPKHPELSGVRTTCNRKCVGCTRDGQKTSAARENKRAYEKERRKWYRKLPAQRQARKIAAMVRRRLLSSRQRPAWADMAAIQRVYAEASHRTKSTGVEHHVDHIVPVNGLKVCGLHVHNNLRVMSGAENMAKGNKYDC